MQVFEVRAIWDPEALVWVAMSDHIPGLATEAPTYDGLIQRVLLVAPELLDANNVPRHERQAIKFVAERDEALAAA
jgi:hypothetical protein